jgi:hypothetical protein
VGTLDNLLDHTSLHFDNSVVFLTFDLSLDCNASCKARKRSRVESVEEKIYLSYGYKNSDVLDCNASCKARKRSRVESEEEKIYLNYGYKNSDVLCGKGKRINRHWGHKLSHREKECFQGRYLQTVAREEKVAISRERSNNGKQPQW